MKPGPRAKYERGFTLIEMLAALGIFLLITGAAFTLLTSSQQRYQTESQVLSSFQEARLGLDQMVRDIDDAGFPPPSYLASGNPNPFNYVTSAPFAWSTGAGYFTNPCQIGTGGGGSCTTSVAGDLAPGDFDIIIETEPNPLDPSCAPACQVQWIRYQLGGPNGTTLLRGMVPKVAGSDPDTAFAGANAPAPFVQNVVNNSPNLQIGQFQLSTAYPTLFPAGASVPIFQYVCDTPSVPQSPPQPCPSAAADNSPANIRDVMITLIIAAPLPDATSGRPRLIQLEGRGRRINPNQ
ncbi:MAG TPA: prepilin-type N-terminal cleavage/methylation domain-containing protein [Candidatus Acidoferrum sp.]|nr:prepilin-type N-terminal cleavage/methylation domain-containing protein [Candidatus Acidoferrum sp.]